MIGWIFAFLMPFLWGGMNVFDKFIVERKVKNVFSLVAIDGLVLVFCGVVFSCFLDWSSITYASLIYPILAGALIGSQNYVYYLLIKKEDISHIIGIIYLYPVIVAIGSFIFFQEKVSMFSYLGIVLVIIGVLGLSLRLKEIKLKTSIWLIVIILFQISIGELLIKQATNNLPVLNGIAVDIIASGIVCSLAFFTVSARKNFSKDIMKLPWLSGSFILYFGAIGFMYASMSYLPATIVSAIGSIQPLFVLFLERIVGSFVGSISRDNKLLPKLIPICLIVIGVAMIYASGI